MNGTSRRMLKKAVLVVRLSSKEKSIWRMAYGLESEFELPRPRIDSSSRQTALFPSHQLYAHLSCYTPYAISSALPRDTFHVSRFTFHGSC